VLNLVSNLQSAIELKLLQDTIFAGPPRIPVVTERHSDFENIIDRIVNKLGLGVVIGTTEFSAGSNLNSFEVTISIGVIENVLLNSGKTASRMPCADLSLAVCAILRNWSPDGLWAPLVFVKAALTEPPPNLVYEVTFKTEIQLHSIENIQPIEG
jgi:hypothetical protein